MMIATPAATRMRELIDLFRFWRPRFEREPRRSGSGRNAVRHRTASRAYEPHARQRYACGLSRLAEPSIPAKVTKRGRIQVKEKNLWRPRKRCVSSFTTP